MPTRIERSLKKPEPSRSIEFDDVGKFEFVKGVVEGVVLLHIPGNDKLEISLDETHDLKDFLVRWLRQVKAKEGK